MLNCDDHKSHMKKFKRDPAACRPDIAHQVSDYVEYAFVPCGGNFVNFVLKLRLNVVVSAHVNGQSAE